MNISRRRLAATATALGGTTLTLVGLAKPARAESADEAAAAKAVEEFRKAMLANDRAQFETLCAAQLSYGHSGGKLQTKDEFIAEATSGKSRWKKLEFSNVKISVAGPNAIARFVLTGQAESEEKLTDVNIGVLMVWQQQNTAWKLLARQAFKL